MINDLIEPSPRRVCPACGSQAGLRHWRDLTEEQQEVVRKLPGTSLYPIAERVARHSWCVVCWHEATGGAPQSV